MNSEENGGIIIVNVYNSAGSEVRCWDWRTAWSNAHSFGTLWWFQAWTSAFQASPALHLLAIVPIPSCSEQGTFWMCLCHVDVDLGRSPISYIAVILVCEFTFLLENDLRLLQLAICFNFSFLLLRAYKWMVRTEIMDC